MEQWNGVYWQQMTGPDPSETDDQFGGIATRAGNTLGGRVLRAWPGDGA